MRKPPKSLKDIVQNLTPPDPDDLNLKGIIDTSADSGIFTCTCGHKAKAHSQRDQSCTVPGCFCEKFGQLVVGKADAPVLITESPPCEHHAPIEPFNPHTAGRAFDYVPLDRLTTRAVDLDMCPGCKRPPSEEHADDCQAVVAHAIGELAARAALPKPATPKPVRRPTRSEVMFVRQHQARAVNTKAIVNSWPIIPQSPDLARDSAKTTLEMVCARAAIPFLRWYVPAFLYAIFIGVLCAFAEFQPTAGRDLLDTVWSFIQGNI